MNTSFRSTSTFVKKTTAAIAIVAGTAGGIGALAITHASASATPSSRTETSQVAAAPRTQTGTQVQTRTSTLRTRKARGPKPASTAMSAITGQHQSAELNPSTANTVSKSTNLDVHGAYSEVAGIGVASSSYFTSCENRVYVHAATVNEELAAGDYSVYFRAYVYDYATARWVGSGWYLADGITSIYLTAHRPASTVWVQYAKYTNTGWQFNSENVTMSVALDSGYSVWGC